MLFGFLEGMRIKVIYIRTVLVILEYYSFDREDYNGVGIGKGRSV